MQKSILWSIVLGLSFVLGCYIVGQKYYAAKKAVSKVTVKGLAEQVVDADLAWWAISTQVAGNSIEEVKTNIAGSIENINKFFKEKGFSSSEIKTDNISVYQNNFRDASYAYSGDIRVVVSSNDVEKVDRAAQETASLIAAGILITGDKYSNGPKYFFTKFNDAKPDMLATATKEAKKSADEFAKHSGSKVGKIAYANQGVFQILPANRTMDNEEFYKQKLLRVVSTVDYFLD